VNSTTSLYSEAFRDTSSPQAGLFYFQILEKEIVGKSVSDRRMALKSDVTALRAIQAFPGEWLISWLVYWIANRSALTRRCGKPGLNSTNHNYQQI
jgi:hypothetical protein